jgi:uncharacterized protein YbjQ (UPF0145 family)
VVLTPFNPDWADQGTKLDLKAIYRRPEAGINLTGPLPVRRHNDWSKKGLKFVSLASGEECAQVTGWLRAQGVDTAELRKSYGGPPSMPFLTDLYIKEQRANDADALKELQAKVDKFGADAVVEMMRMSDSGFVLPASIAVPVEAKKAGK